MTNINEFIEAAKNEIFEILPEDLTRDLVIEENRVVKMNDQVLNGLTIRKSSEEAAPTFYMNDLFDRYMNGEPLKPMMAEVCQGYLDALVTKPEIMETDLSFDNIKDNLSIRIVEADRNKEFLQENPYMMMGNGFAAVCDIRVHEDNGGYWKTTVTRGLMEDNNYDKTDLFKTAIENSQVTDPVVMYTMASQLFFDGGDNLLDIEGQIPENMKSNMYIITSRDQIFGATTLFYPGVQEIIAEKLGEGYYALPSSVHEFIILPESGGITAKNAADMVYEANHSGIVDPKDVLSDNIFYYDQDTKKLETIRSEVAREVRDESMRS